MRQVLPLSLKLILPLAALQLGAISLGVTWISSRLVSLRLREIDQALDSQADAIEDAVTVRDRRIMFDPRSEMARELYADKNVFFSIMTTDGDTLDESQGPSPGVRSALREHFKKLNSQDEQVVSIEVQEAPWRIVREIVSPSRLEKAAHGSLLPQGVKGTYLFAAVNVGPAMTELSLVRRDLVLSTVFLICLIGVGTSVIVSRTTSNLRSMAHSLRQVKPENPVWKAPARPRSAEEHLLFESFQAMLTAIKKSSDAQRVFIADASHELKTPVAGMLMALEVMLTKRRTPEEYELVGRDLLKTVHGLRRLSGTLLDLARLENQVDVEIGILDLGEILRNLSDRWTSVANQRGIAIVFHGSMRDLKVRGNRELLEVALGNFIDNAIKYSNAGGHVDVTGATLPTGSGATVRVLDHGIGITGGAVKHLGEVFFRANEARLDDQSFGLGFAQAQKIIKLLGGAVFVKSQPGRGTEITVTLDC